MNILADEDSNISFPAATYEIDDERIDVVALMYKDPESYIKSFKGYIVLVTSTILKIVYKGETYLIDTLAECEITLKKRSENMPDDQVGEQKELRKYTKNTNSQFTGINVSTWTGKLVIVNLREYSVRENSLALPDQIDLKEVVERYLKSQVRMEKVLRVNKLCTFKDLCFESFEFNFVENMVLVGIQMGDK